MSKHHKRSKRKGKRRDTNTTIQEISNRYGEVILSSTSLEEEVETLQTPFGDIKIHDGTLAYTFKNKGVLVEILTMNKQIEEDDSLGRLIFFEKLYDKYPNEPFIAHAIVECYYNLKKKEKAQALTVNNYEKYKGYPLIDVGYMELKHDLDQEDVMEEIFGKGLNIHEIYPNFKAFDADLVARIYLVAGMLCVKRGDLATAKDCLTVVNEISNVSGLFLKTKIDHAEKPWLKWKSRFFVLLLLLLVISIIGGVIWGIISLFKMIF